MKAEYISREKTLKAIRTSVSEVFNVASNAGRMYQKITEIVESVPAADVVPVVRCRDCVYDDTIECPLCYIEKKTLTWINHDGDFFCAKGKRKG